MVLFENTLLLSVLGFLLLTALVVRGFIVGQVSGKQILLSTVFTATLVAASWFIETPREQIAATCRVLARLVDDGDINELERRLASDFEANGLDREAFLDRVSAMLSRTRLDHVRIRGIDVTLEGQRGAIATFDANCNIRSAEDFTAALPSRWRLRFEKDGEQWLLQQVESIPVPPLNLRNPFTRV